MNNHKTIANTLVILQFGFIILIAVTAPWIAISIPTLAIEFIGLFIGFWAVQAMGWRQVSIKPLVREGGQLITNGPYKYIRHPMYTAVLTTLTPLVLDYFSWYRLGMIIALLITLCIKCRFEENRLLEAYPGYEDYMKQTRRIIPFVY
ncbi:MAG: isoprenylcysteine carboxylmethyltransferase family protein [Bacteroidales bacterium]|nr:isoprenylcysteine carboxylmethyltransferase family protein [Bacteroidales bacterium]